MISFGKALTKCLNKLKGFRRYYVRINSPAGRDLVREFVDECNAQGVVPFFYHTQLIEDLVGCRKFDCNFLLNVGPRIDGSIKPLDKYTLLEIGKWINYYKNFIYNVRPFFN